MEERTYSQFVYCTSDGEPLGIDAASGGYPWLPMKEHTFGYLPGDHRVHTVRVTITIHLNEIE